MRRVVLHIIAAFLRVAAIAMRILPVRNRVVLMSRQSEKLSLDFHLLMEWMKRSCPDIPVQACLSSPETKGITSFAVATMRQLLLSQTSSVVIVDGYVPAVSVPSKRTKVYVIQLWHALGAIKKFGYQCLDTPEGRDGDSARILRMHRNYDCVVAGGPWAIEPLAQAFDCPETAIAPLGLPRTDYLLSADYQDDRQKTTEKLISLHPRLKDELPVIVYAPTFRRADMAYGKELLAKLADSFANLPLNLVYSGHPLGEEDMSGSSFPNNVVVSQRVTTLDWLLVADAVITDYSAIAYEAAIKGIPVFFYVPDVDAYQKSPGLNVDIIRCFSDCSSKDVDAVVGWITSSKGFLSSFTDDVQRDYAGHPKDIVKLIEERL